MGEAITGRHPIEVEGVSKVYGSTLALDDVSLEVSDGEIFGLLGPNGAGKSTLLETVAGLRRPTSGGVRVFGVDPARERTATTARVGMQPQSAALFESLTVLETVRMYASFHTRPRAVGDLVDQLGLTSQSGTRARDLSGGQQRRLLIGAALVGEPRLVILDEPSAGLDPQAKRDLHDLIRDVQSRGTTVVVSTHDMTEATELCDRVGILVGGTLRALGSPDDLISARAAMTTVTFRVPVETTEDALRTHLPDAEISATVRGAVRTVTAATPDPDGVIRALTFAPALRASDYRVRRDTLEDAYLAFLADAPVISGRAAS